MAAPDIVNGKVPPKRRKNADSRPREYLIPDEIERLMDAAGSVGRHRHRDRTLILIAYRHGLRVSELVSLRWDMVDLKQGLIHVSRLKNGQDSVHHLRGPKSTSVVVFSVTTPALVSPAKPSTEAVTLWVPTGTSAIE